MPIMRSMAAFPSVHLSERARRVTRRHVLRRLFLALGLGLLLLVALWLMRIGVRAVICLYDWATLQNALDADGDQVVPAVRALGRDYRALRAELGLFPEMTRVLFWLPPYGADLATLPDALSLADRIAEAFEPTLDAYAALEEKLSAGSAPGVALVTVAREEAATIREARARLRRVGQARDRISTRALSPQAQALVRALDEGLAEWDAALALWQRAPTLLGADHARTYLVLAQNSDEIRPTGGFISAAGVIRVEDGEFNIEFFGDSYALDDLALWHPPPPAPLQKYMWASQWLLRDSNWFAHFPTSADVAQSMYARDRGLRTDGVIAVDLRWMPQLVRALPGLTLNGEPLTAENIIASLKASWKPLPPGEMSPAWFANDRKNALVTLFEAMMQRVKTGQVKPAALASALWRGLRTKSLQVFLNDAEAEDALLKANWGGAVAPGEADYLFVVDSNVGFNKVNAHVTREIEYTVRLGEDGADAVVAITYINPSRAIGAPCDLHKQNKDNTYASMEQSCYWNYVRVLVPRGSRLTATDGMSDAGIAEDVESITAFGGYVIVPRGETRTVRFAYALPARVVQDGAYELKWQQQAGMPPTRTRVRIELPRGMEVRTASHSFTRRGAYVIEFEAQFERDTILRVEWTWVQHAP